MTTDENGLYYMRARYYNPDIKRFINQDIKVGDIGSSQSLNRYAYCEGNPVSMIDPFGLCGEDAQDQGSESKYKYLHAALDILGFAFDGADLINAGIYALENDWVNAGLCLVSFIPVAGSAIVGVAKSAKALKKLKTAEKVASFVAENGKNIRTASHMTEITHDTMKVIGECGSDTLKVVDGLSVNASYKGIRMLETGSDSAAKGAKKAIWEIQEAVGSEGIKFSTRVEESVQALKKTSSKRIKSGSKPIGATYEGTIYRSVDSRYDPLEMSQYTINSNHRYTESGVPGLYFSSGEKIVKAELGNYDVFDFSNRTMYSYDVRLTNMLDVSNPSVRSQLGISLDSIVGESYDVTHAIGRYAYSNGYNGIIAPSARADGGINIILFNAKGVK